MKKFVSCIALVSLFALVPSVRVLAQDAAPKHEKHEDTELDLAMKKIGKPMRALGKQIADASKNEDSLKLVASAREAAEECLKFKPSMTDTLPADAQAKFVAEYQESIKALIADFDKLTAALKSNDNAKAAAVLAEIKDAQKQGHRSFRKKDGK